MSMSCLRESQRARRKKLRKEQCSRKNVWMGWLKSYQRTRVDIMMHKYQHALVGKLLLTKATERILLLC